MKKIAFVLLLALLTLAAACRTSKPNGGSGTPNPPFEGDAPQEAYISQAEAGNYGGQLVMAIPNDPRSFNIILATDTATAFVGQNHLFRCLVDYRNGGDPPDYDNGVCTKWESTPDAKEWTFYIRKGVRWSDGQPFTADDVLFTYEVIKDEKVQNSLRDVFRQGTTADNKPIYPDLEKVNDTTVRFKLHQSNGAFLDSIFNLYPVPKHKWEQTWREGKFNEAMALNTDPKDVVGLGPFRLKEYTSGQRIVLERNPYFWKVDKKGQRLPYLDRLIFIITRDFNVITAKFNAGEIDVMDRVRGEEFTLVKQMESADVKVEDVGISLDCYWLMLNQNTGTNAKTGKPYVEPWKAKLYRNQKFRQALSYGIDREGLANTVFAGRAVPIFSLVSPGDKTWYSDTVMKYPYNKDLAKQTLAEVGLKDTNGDGFLEDAEGHTVEIKINTNAGNSQREATAAFIVRNLQDIGIKSSSTPIAFQTINEMLESSFNYDAIVLGWQAGVPPGMPNVKNVIVSSSQNHTFFPGQKTPSTEWEGRIDQLVKQIDETLDVAKRKEMFGEIQRIWSEQMAEINLISERLGIAYKNKFANIRPTTLPPRITWNAEEIYIRK